MLQPKPEIHGACLSQHLNLSPQCHSLEAHSVQIRGVEAGSVIVSLSVVGFLDKAGADAATAILLEAPPTEAFGKCVVTQATTVAASGTSLFMNYHHGNGGGGEEYCQPKFLTKVLRVYIWNSHLLIKFYIVIVSCSR